MKALNSFFSKYSALLWTACMVVLFVLSRAYIWIYRPMEFTEILYSYMPYAHLWAGGMKPYLEQLYEYPPATIPLFYIPHMIDMTTRWWAIHSNYLDSYRGILLLFDTFLFWLVWRALRAQKVAFGMMITALVYYMIVTAKAHHFIYDTMDLTFATAIVLGIVAPLLWKKPVGNIISWTGVFLATALKYINAPMIPIYALLERKDLKTLFISGTIGFLLIWAVPLAIFRSSISVSLYYQNIRGIQVDSAPGTVVRTMNVFTKTEHFIEVYKNYETAGPITDQTKQVVKYFFPLAVLSYLAFASFLIWKYPHLGENWLRIHLTLGYILVFTLTGKVLSTPFLLWHIPLIALYPYKRVSQQLTFFAVSIAIIFASMTKVGNDAIGIFPIPLIIAWIRIGGFSIMFILWSLMTWEAMRLPQPNTVKEIPASKKQTPKRKK